MILFLRLKCPNSCFLNYFLQLMVGFCVGRTPKKETSEKNHKHKNFKKKTMLERKKMSQKPSLQLRRRGQYSIKKIRLRLCADSIWIINTSGKVTSEDGQIQSVTVHTQSNRQFWRSVQPIFTVMLPFDLLIDTLCPFKLCYYKMAACS